MPSDKGKRQTEQNPGKGLPAGQKPNNRRRTRRRARRVSNQVDRAAREAARAETAAAGKGEAELPPVGAPPPAAETAAAAADRPILPAWVASYTNHVKMALLRRDGMESLPESIPITGDDRVQVSLTQDTTAFPWRCLCRLDITSQNGNRYLGTGWLVSLQDRDHRGPLRLPPRRRGMGRRDHGDAGLRQRRRPVWLVHVQ